jgi:DNA polymerase-4
MKRKRETHMRRRHIVHLDIPDFYAALEQLRRPELKKRPLVLAESSSRSVVQGVNNAARSEGIREGMSLEQVRKLCRRLQVVPPDLSFYKEQHRMILKELDRFSPLVEGSHPGHYFVDLTGTQRLWGPSPDTACRLERRLADQRQLHAQVGLGHNKLISQVAARCVPPGDLGSVFSGWEKSFLTPLPVEILPGVGVKTVAFLSDLNIRKIGQLASFSPQMITAVLGKAGLRLLKLAQGEDLTSVIPFQKAVRLSLTHHLGRDEIDWSHLEISLFQQVEEAAWVLRRHNHFPGEVVVEIRYADGVTVQGRESLSAGIHRLDRRFFEVIRSVFERLFQRRVALRRIVLRFQHLTMPFRQLTLFPWEEENHFQEEGLQKALDSVRLRFGRQAISWGRVLELPPSDGNIPGEGDRSSRFQWSLGR